MPKEQDTKKKRASDRRANPVYVDPRYNARRESAHQRELTREARTTVEQLTLLDIRPGKSVRERARLTDTQALKSAGKETR